MIANAQIGLAWHDVVCPEAEDCRDRSLHAASMPLCYGGTMRRFLDRLDQITHLPRRGSDVEAWIRREREACDTWGDRQGWLLLDGLLDQYRLRADLGLTLTEEIETEEVS